MVEQTNKVETEKLTVLLKKISARKMELQHGKFSELEESLFLTGMQKYGRDWQAIARHVKTRDAKSIRSRAQRHFIKLFRDGAPLPASVAAR